ncbi:hypothetical protein H6G89_31400 [Oscillatoria sp. FACHB-1407]|nr:hypothetical protein [Oscillatoria sp. FACHB-1407]
MRTNQSYGGVWHCQTRTSIRRVSNSNEYNVLSISIRSPSANGCSYVRCIEAEELLQGQSPAF